LSKVPVPIGVPLSLNTTVPVGISLGVFNDCVAAFKFGSPLLKVTFGVFVSKLGNTTAMNCTGLPNSVKLVVRIEIFSYTKTCADFERLEIDSLACYTIDEFALSILIFNTFFSFIPNYYKNLR
jgi:hypothetical protein